MRKVMTGWMGRADEGPPDPSHVELVKVVLPILGPPERWAVYTVPGPRDLPGPDAPRGRRDRWWRDHISAAGGALLLTDPDVDPAAVRRAVELLTTCALARDRGILEPADIAARSRSSAAWTVGAPTRPGEQMSTAMAVVRTVATMFNRSAT